MEKNGSGQTDRQTLVRSSANVLWVEGQTGEESLERQRGWTLTGTLPQRKKLDPDMCIYMHRAYTRTKLSQEKSEKLSELERKRAGAEGASCTRAHTHTQQE